MPVNSLYDRLVTLSPHIEMLARRLFYRFRPVLERFNTRAGKSAPSEAVQVLDASLFDELVDTAIGSELNRHHSRTQPATVAGNAPATANLSNRHPDNTGSGDQDIVILHSTYASLKQFNQTPEQLVHRLRQRLGSSVTIAMPAIPMYPNEIGKKSLTEEELKAARYKYTVGTSRIWTGALPKALLKEQDRVASQHPLNTMVAVGRQAAAMMEHNLATPYPCGEGSSWDYCLQQNALIVGLGNDLTHSLTMIHAAEDRHPEQWHAHAWYMDRVFKIKDAAGIREVAVKERRHHWGKLHFAERNLARDLLRAGFMQSQTLHGVVVESIRARALVDYLESRNRNGYPYFWLPGPDNA